MFVPENLPVLKLLKLLRQSGRHVALVIDEYGDIQGLVTPQDIFKSIVGDIASDRPLERITCCGERRRLLASGWECPDRRIQGNLSYRSHPG